MNPKGLRKQNFVEDGQSIMGSQRMITAAQLKKNLNPNRYDQTLTVDSEAKEFKMNRGFAKEIKGLVENDRLSQFTDHH